MVTTERKVLDSQSDDLEMESVIESMQEQSLERDIFEEPEDKGVLRVQQNGVMLELTKSATGKYSFRAKAYRIDMKQAQEEIFAAERWFNSKYGE